MPLVLFISPSDPRMVKTLEALMKAPKDGGLVSNSLVFRYNLDLIKDGVTGKEGTFNICSFWLLACLFEVNFLQVCRSIDESRKNGSGKIATFATYF